MGRFKSGTLIRLISNPVAGFRDIGEVFIAAEYTEGEAPWLRGNDLDSVQIYLGRDGKPTHCPANYFESAGPVRTEVVMSTKLVAGVYGRVHIEPINPVLAAVRFVKRSGEPIGSNQAHLNAAEWRALAALASEIAEFLE